MMANDLTYYWSMIPGKFVMKTTGEPLHIGAPYGPSFQGLAHEWYETLAETINSIARMLDYPHDAVLNLTVSPDIAWILEQTVSYRRLPSQPTDLLRLDGTLNHRFNVYVNLAAERNLAAVSWKEGPKGFVRILDLHHGLLASSF